MRGWTAAAGDPWVPHCLSLRRRDFTASLTSCHSFFFAAMPAVLQVHWPNCGTGALAEAMLARYVSSDLIPGMDDLSPLVSAKEACMMTACVACYLVTASQLAARWLEIHHCMAWYHRGRAACRPHATGRATQGACPFIAAPHADYIPCDPLTPPLPHFPCFRSRRIWH